MDIYELSNKSNVSIRTLRKIEKFGVLNIQKSKNPIIDEMKKNLNHGNRLTAVQQLHLVKNPKDAKLLLRWEDEVQVYLDALGDVMREKMPWDISANAAFAASRDMEAADNLAQWFCNFIDRNPAFANGANRNHAYLAVRMLADIPDHLLHLTAPVVSQAMWNCRRTKRMAGYWHIDPKTRRTLYHRPAGVLDL